MICAKNNRVGIDAKIYLLQTYLDAKLNAIWNSPIVIYGRVYANQKETGAIPEVWNENNDYRQIYFNDKNAATVCFIVTERNIQTKGNVKANIDIVFLINVKQTLGTSQRSDELAMLQVIDLIRKSQLAKTSGEIKEGIANVFSGFNVDAIKFRDMQPYAVFSIPCEIHYNENLC